MNYSVVTSNRNPVCPMCGSNQIKFQMRSAGTQGSANYYHIHSRKSWVFPSWHKTYRSKRKYKSVGLCQNCGYCFEPYLERGFLYYFLCLLILPLFLGYLFFTSKWFKENKKKFFKTLGIVIAVSLILIIILYLIGISLSNPVA